MSRRKVLPLEDWCLVQRLHQDVTEAGVHIPPTAQDRQPDALILEVGPGYFDSGMLIEPRVRKGDKVLIDPGKLGEVRGFDLDGEVRFLVRARHLMAVIGEESERN